MFIFSIPNIRVHCHIGSEENNIMIEIILSEILMFFL